MDNSRSLSPFIFNDPVVPPIFAGRKTELAIIQNALFNEKESLAIYGNDAIGKSSIIGTIYKEIDNLSNEKILPVRINAFDFISAVKTDFLGLATHQICAAIWTRLIGRKYSELIEDSLLNKAGGIFESPEELTIKRIFRIITSIKMSGRDSSNQEIGGKFFIEGKASHANEFFNERKPLESFEFMHLLDELNDIIKVYKYDSIIVFCDELNHLPRDVNSEILRNYFSIFSSKKIRFFITVVNPNTNRKAEAENLFGSFNHRMEIGTYKSANDVSELISNSISLIKSNIIFDMNCSKVLFELTEGHPWWIQKICDASFGQVQKSKLTLVNAAIIEECARNFKDEIRIYKELVSMGLPFRKSNLLR